MTYPYPIPCIVQKNARGEVVSWRRLRFVNLRDIRPLNLKQIQHREGAK